jgi:hypothetical protein
VQRYDRGQAGEVHAIGGALIDAEGKHRIAIALRRGRSRL